MDPAYLSALAALAGSAIGGLTSLGASWLSNSVQFTAQERSANRKGREDLYKSFIEEAAKWYADAYQHDHADVSNLVNLYALVSKMRLVSSRKVIESADRVVRTIVDTYLAPNRTLRDVTKLMDNKAENPLRDFGNACRAELGGASI